MAKTLGVLKHLRFEDALGERTCRAHASGANEKKIKPGEKHLVVDYPRQGQKYYCLDAAHDILSRAQVDLQELLDDL